MMRLQSGVTGVNIINLQAPGSCVLCAYGHQVVNVFLLVGVFHICKATQEIVSNTIIWVLQRGAKAEDMGEGSWLVTVGWSRAGLRDILEDGNPAHTPWFINSLLSSRIAYQGADVEDFSPHLNTGELIQIVCFEGALWSTKVKGHIGQRGSVSSLAPRTDSIIYNHIQVQWLSAKHSKTWRS